jgi:hypothetical protein
MKNKTLIIILSLLLLVFMTGCTKSIAEIKSEEFIDENVSVKGTVLNTIKLGDLSGYTIQDENKDTIFVSSKSLPAEDSKMTAKGTLKKNLLGYYIESND